MNIGVKYCGGCNPRYNRTKFFQTVKQGCENIEFQYVQPDVVYEHLLVICGCPSKCADISAIQVAGETIKVSEADRAEDIIERLRKTCEPL